MFVRTELLPLIRKAHSNPYDSFNLFSSSYRIQVEQAFCYLVARWGIIWRPHRFSLPSSMLILTIAMRLQNFATNEDGVRNTIDFEGQGEHENTSGIFNLVL